MLGPHPGHDNQVAADSTGNSRYGIMQVTRQAWAGIAGRRDPPDSLTRKGSQVANPVAPTRHNVSLDPPLSAACRRPR